MTITVVADDLNQARHKLGLRHESSPISITWRGDGHNDFRPVHLTGCIVNATRMGTEGGALPLEFETSKAALRHIAKLLAKHDAYVRSEKIERDKKARQQAKEAKAKK